MYSLPPEGAFAPWDGPAALKIWKRNTMKLSAQPITLLVCALGGEGGGVLAEWLVEAARRAGHPAQATSIPGVAQRTGATTYYLEFSPLPADALDGRRPVFGLNPLPGRLDLLVSSELLETARQIGNGMTSGTHTRIITSSARTLTTRERMVPGDGRQDEAALLSLIRSHSREHHVVDMAGLTRQAGTVVSAVLFGCIAASGLLPWGREVCEATVREAGGAGAEASLRGFALGFEAIDRQRAQARQIDRLLAPEARDLPPAPSLPAALAQALAQWPEPLRDRVALGLARVIDYQDAAYGALYLQRLRGLQTAEQQADPAGLQGLAATHEAARWLALWMSFDDIVRVADLKRRASRWQRVRAETRAAEGELLKVWEHFKPGLPEIAGLLPAAWAQRLLAIDRRRQARGQPAWTMPVRLGTHTVHGQLALAALAGLRWLRPRGTRWAEEQRRIGLWLTAVESGLRADARLGLELARCGRLTKGYGETHERGRGVLDHLLVQFGSGSVIADPRARADALAQAREAALADAGGQALDATLRAHGAAPRPLREQPIRWMRRPGAARP